MEIFFVAPIQNFERTEKDTLQLGPNLTLHSPGDTEILELFKINDFAFHIGAISIEKIAHSSVLLMRGDVKPITEYFGVKAANRLGHIINASFDALLSGLWFVRDNSSFCPTGYLHNCKENWTFRDNRNMFYSAASGSYEETTFEEADLRHAIAVNEFMEKIFSDKTFFKEPNWASEEDFVQHGSAVSKLNYAKYDFNRVERSFHMLAIARAQSLLNMRISFYMGVVECLFSNGGEGLADKVAQRVALFLGGDKEAQYSNYITIKDAYKVRSKFLHGDTEKASYDKL